MVLWVQSILHFYLLFAFFFKLLIFISFTHFSASFILTFRIRLSFLFPVPYSTNVLGNISGFVRFMCPNCSNQYPTVFICAFCKQFPIYIVTIFFAYSYLLSKFCPQRMSDLIKCFFIAHFVTLNYKLNTFLNWQIYLFPLKKLLGISFLYMVSYIILFLNKYFFSNLIFFSFYIVQKNQLTIQIL